MSPTIANASVMRPPAPMPWMARVAMSSGMFWLAPAKADPMRNTTMANWNTLLRPYRSETFPYSGVDAVEVSR